MMAVTRSKTERLEEKLVAEAPLLNVKRPGDQNGDVTEKYCLIETVVGEAEKEVMAAALCCGVCRCNLTLDWKINTKPA